MKKKFTFLMAAFMLLMMILPGQAVGQTFKRISSSSTLSDGDQIIFVNQAETYACGTTQNSNNRTPVEISVSDHTYSYVSTDDVQVFTVKINDSGEFGFHTGSGYLYSKSSSKNQINTNTTAATTAPSGTAAWSLSVSSSVFTCKNVTNTSYYLAFNGTDYFSQYNTGQSKPYIYERAYTVTYNAGGGIGTMTDTDSPYTSGETVSLMDNTFTKDDFEFSGWLVKDELNNEVTVTEGHFTMPRGNVTVTAQWTPATTDPYFDVEDVDLVATATTGTIEYKVENSVTGGKISASCLAGGSWISDVTVTDEDSDDNTITFTTSVNAEAERIGTIRITYTYDSDKTKTADVTITQAIAQYTVTYQANGGTGGPVVKTYNYGTNVIVLAYNDEAIGFTAPSGKSFKNWKENSNTYNAGATISSINANHTLAAQWEDIPKFYLVTNTNQIVAGKHYVIVSSNVEGDAYGIGAPNGTYRDRTSVTISKDSENKLYVLKTGSLSDFVLSGPDTDNKWTIYDQNNSVYLYGGSKGTLGGNSGSPTIPNNAKWTVGITDDGDVEFNNSDFLIEHNASASRFASYAGTMGKVYLYVKNNDTDLEIYSPTIIAANKTVECDTYTIGNDNASLTIADGGQLICNNSVAVTMEKTVTAYVDADEGDWYTLSTPVHTGDNAYVTFANVENITYMNPSNTEEPLYNVYYLDEPTNKWINNLYGSGFSQLNNGKGYIYRRAEGTTLEFNGNTNVDDVVCPLSYNENIGDNENPIKGFNLVGNPFTHDITWTNVTSKTQVSTDGYYLLDTDGKWSAEASTTATIAPMTAFLVEATGNGASITLKNIPEGKDMNYANDNIMFTVKNAEYSDIAYVLFKEGHGLNKIDHRNAEIPMLYVINNGENFAIADMSDNTSVINLGFEAKTMGEYTISLKAEGQYSYMHLIDKLTGEDIDMLVEDSYTFIGSQNDRKDRFVLNLNYNAAGIDSESDIFAYQSGSDIIVSGEGELQVFDITGRKVMTTNINGVETINGMNTGVYILKLNGKAQKIVVR